MCDLKLERLCEHIAQHHIAVLVETRTNDVVSIFATALPSYTVYHIPISSTMIGRKGNGVAVLIDQSIHDFVTVWHVSEQIQAIWLKCAGQVFNVPGNVALGAVYLNPKTDNWSNSDITESFENFFDEATTASLMNFTNVLMMAG